MIGPKRRLLWFILPLIDQLPHFALCFQMTPPRILLLLFSIIFPLLLLLLLNDFSRRRDCCFLLSHHCLRLLHLLLLIPRWFACLPFFLGFRPLFWCQLMASLSCLFFLLSGLRPGFCFLPVSWHAWRRSDHHAFFLCLFFLICCILLWCFLLFLFLFPLCFTDITPCPHSSSIFFFPCILILPQSLHPSWPSSIIINQNTAETRGKCSDTRKWTTAGGRWERREWYLSFCSFFSAACFIIGILAFVIIWFLFSSSQASRSPDIHHQRFENGQLSSPPCILLVFFACMMLASVFAGSSSSSAFHIFFAILLPVVFSLSFRIRPLHRIVSEVLIRIIILSKNNSRNNNRDLDSFFNHSRFWMHSNNNSDYPPPPVSESCSLLSSLIAFFAAVFCFLSDFCLLGILYSFLPLSLLNFLCFFFRPQFIIILSSPSSRASIQCPSCCSFPHFLVIIIISIIIIIIIHFSCCCWSFFIFGESKTLFWLCSSCPHQCWTTIVSESNYSSSSHTTHKSSSWFSL